MDVLSDNDHLSYHISLVTPKKSNADDILKEICSYMLKERSNVQISFNTTDEAWYVNINKQPKSLHQEM